MNNVYPSRYHSSSAESARSTWRAFPRRLMTVAILVLFAVPAHAAGKRSASKKPDTPGAMPKAYWDTAEKSNYIDFEAQMRLAKIAKDAGSLWLARRHEFAARAARFMYDAGNQKLLKEETEQAYRKLASGARRARLPSYEWWAKRRAVTRAFERHSAALADDDQTGRKALFRKALSIGRADLARRLAEKLLAGDQVDDSVRVLAGQVRVNGSWVDPWQWLVDKRKTRDRAARIKLHRLMQAQRLSSRKSYPPDPFGGGFLVGWGKDKPEALPLLLELPGLDWAPQYYHITLPRDYTTRKKWPLIVCLHGGGCGDHRRSVYNLCVNTMVHIRAPGTDQFPGVMVYPAAGLHCQNAWAVRMNMEAVIDCIIDVLQRCPIDERRIYLMGASMGANGTARISWALPEAFTRHMTLAGAYWTRGIPIPDLTGVEYLILHGMKDSGGRNKSLTAFAKVLDSRHATYDIVKYPQEGHDLPSWGKGGVNERCNAWFSTTKDYATDWHLAKRIVAETVKDKASWCKCGKFPPPKEWAAARGSSKRPR